VVTKLGFDMSVQIYEQRTETTSRIQKQSTSPKNKMSHIRFIHCTCTMCCV